MSNGHSLGDLIVEITQDLSRLVRKEIELAKQETAELVRPKLMAGALIAVGAVLGMLLLPFILFTFYLILSIWLLPWVAALVVTLITAAACGTTFLIAKSKLAGKLVPTRTIRTLKEDVEWAKHLKK